MLRILQKWIIFLNTNRAQLYGANLCLVSCCVEESILGSQNPHLFPELSMELPDPGKAFILQSSCKEFIPLPSPCSLLQDSDKWPTLALGECLPVVVQSLPMWPTLCDLRDCSMQAFCPSPAPGFNQTHVH